MYTFVFPTRLIKGRRDETLKGDVIRNQDVQIEKVKRTDELISSLIASIVGFTSYVFWFI